MSFTALTLLLFALVAFAAYQQNEYDGGYSVTNKPAESSDDRLATYTLWLTIFTGVLAIGTMALWWVTERTLEHGREDSERRARDSAAALTVATATQRAWLGIMDIETAKIDVLENWFQVAYTVTVHNYGQSPAISVWIDAEAVISEAFSHEVAVTWDGFRRTGKLSQGHITVFPGDHVAQGVSVSVPIQREEGATVFLFIGVFYRVIGDGQPHETCDVMRIEGIPAELPFDRVDAFRVRHTLLPATID